MQYQSTRDKNVRVSSAFAIKTGLAADGGLFVPEQIPHLSSGGNCKPCAAWLQRARSGYSEPFS